MPIQILKEVKDVMHYGMSLLYADVTAGCIRSESGFAAVAPCRSAPIC
jgi:hypothetical protein